jgi:hypothetical protein
MNARIDTSVEPEMIDAYQAALDALEDGVSWVDGNGTTIRPAVVARPPQQGEAEALYEKNRDGTLQVLGFSIPVPDELRDLQNRAWDRACRSE